MSPGLTTLAPDALDEALEEVLLNRFASLLTSRGAGHCMRTTDLDKPLMRRLCMRLRERVGEAQAYVLAPQDEAAQPYSVTATKLVELRNPRPDGSLRPPLLVFVPHGLRTASEDSFGVATFESVGVGDAYDVVAARTMERLPSPLRGPVGDVLATVEAEEWAWADARARVRFLLTVLANEADEEVVGGALFELGLVPDFVLLDKPASVTHRLRRNLQAVRELTYSDRSERARVLDLGLRSPEFEAALGVFLADIGVEDPKAWTRRIVTDRANWRFSFDKWPLEESADPASEVFVEVVELGLPILREGEVDDDRDGLVGDRVLTIGQQGLSKFSVRFRTSPAPTKVQGLARFQAQVLRQDGAAIGLSRRKKAWSHERPGTVTFNRFGSVDWEEGWHFVRVLALTEDGDLVPLVDEEGAPLPWGHTGEQPGARPNESELFYVIPSDEVDVEPPQRSIPRYPSRAHAELSLRAKALAAGRDAGEVAAREARWAGSGQGADTVRINYGRDGAVNVPVPRVFRRVEQAAQQQPEDPTAWHFDIVHGEASEPTQAPLSWPSGAEAEAFLEARRAYMEALREGDEAWVGGEAPTVQAAALEPLLAVSRAYAAAYGRLLEALLRRIEGAERGGSGRQGSGTDGHVSALHDLRSALSLDRVTLTVRDHRGRVREGVLIGPTHPVRALWLATWGATAGAWMGAAQARASDFAPLVESGLAGLAPRGVPAAAPEEEGRLFAYVDNIHEFWSLYAPAEEEDPRGLVGLVSGALGLPEPQLVGSTVDGRYLADRLRRYLVQHPYVRTLVINAFNPGQGGLLVDALLALQRTPGLEDVRYDVRIFAPDPEAAGLGRALEDLTAPTGSITSKEADAFSSRSGDHLHPKLAVSRSATAEFRVQPGRYEAHVTLLLDVFPPEEVAVGPGPPYEAAPVHGLVQAYDVEYVEDGATVAWHRRPEHGSPAELRGGVGVAGDLASLQEKVSQATAVAATGRVAPGVRPEVTLTLRGEDRDLIAQVHEVSDWVFTVDRNLGIEFFDHDRPERPDYLIDHSPDVGVGGGYQLVVTSRSTTELREMLRVVLEERRLPTGEGQEEAVLDALRGLSGMLALKFLAAPSHRAEALGLALAELFLEQQGALNNQVVIPLDAHLELYDELKEGASGVEGGLQRTDLALFDLDAAKKTLTCRLVEVKCYTAVGNLGAYVSLKDRMAEQIRQSERVIQYHFDPLRTDPDRPDRPLKTHQLRTLLRFYLDRAVRFGRFSTEAEAEARALLAGLESGYRLLFTRSALVFDFGKSGVEVAEKEGGVGYSRLGEDLIRALIEEAATGKTVASTTVPDLERAGFMAEPRERGGAVDGAVSVAGGSSGEPSVGSPHEPNRAGSQTDDRAGSRTDDREGAGIEGAIGIMEGLGSRSDEKPDAHAESSAHAESTDRACRVGGKGRHEGQETEGSSRTPESEESGVEGAGSGGAVAEGNPEPKEGGPASEHSGSEHSGSGGVATEEAGGGEPAAEHATGGGREGTEYRDESEYDVVLGVTGRSPQYGILGEVAGRKVALDLNHTHTISLFGVQGGGKSYTLGTIVEMATAPIPRINRLPQPLATVIFHYSPTQDYRPEFTSMTAPNDDASQLERLRERYGAEPQGLGDIVLLAPADKVDERRREFPGIEVRPLLFRASELQVAHWLFLMGAVGSQAAYIRHVKGLMRRLRGQLTLEALRNAVDSSSLPDSLKSLASMRLDFAAHYIDEEGGVGDLVRPGRLVIVDLRDELIEKDEALGLFVVLLQLFSDARSDGSDQDEPLEKNEVFNKLIVFDEAHKYIDSPDLVAGLVEVVREMRHKGTSVMVASQDPPSVPVPLIELSSQIILHRFNSPAWLKHIQRANAALGELSPEAMAHLAPGEAHVWSSKASDGAFSTGTMRVMCRPRVTRHGGATRTAV